MIRTLMAAALGLAVVASGAAEAKKKSDPQTGFLFHTWKVGDRQYPYAVYVPRNYDAGKPWPLVLFLHGAGESGTDGSKMVIQGLGSAIQWHADQWPFIAIFPQKPSAATQWEQHDDALMGILKSVRDEYNVDANRLYLTGLSQGGHGTWVLGARHNDLWAAVAIVAGYGGGRSRSNDTSGLPPAFNGTPSEIGTGLKDIPVQVFHGEIDTTVPLAEDQVLVDAVKAAGGDVTLTVFPGIGHEDACWNKSYRDSGLAEWFLAHPKKAATK